MAQTVYADMYRRIKKKQSKTNQTKKGLNIHVLVLVILAVLHGAAQVGSRSMPP
jgi:hypothetical protein